MRVFKYVSQYGPNILSTQKIYCSTADQLNDPFELSPSIDLAQFTLARTVQFLRQGNQLDKFYKEEGRGLGFTNKKKYKKYYLSTLEERASKLLPKIPENVEASRLNFAKTFGKHWRLFCTSLRHDSTLMWSHYAANHTGAVIELDLSCSPFRDLKPDHIFPVKYSKEKADFRYRPKKEKSFMSALLGVAKTKSEDWKYEEEVRLIFPSTSCTRGHFIQIEHQAIKRVYLGCRCSDKDKASILNILNHPNLVHVGVSQASLAKQNYALEFTEIKKGA